MEQQIFIREMVAHFNLREPKSEKPTPIYMVIRIGRKQLKFPIGCKIYPSQWNKKTERAFISPLLTELDNQNNFIVNSKISHFLFLFSQFLQYICNEPQNIDDMERKLREDIGKGKKTRATKKEDAIRWLFNDLERASMKAGSKANYEQQLKDFETFCKDTNRVPLQWEEITYNLLTEYEDWLMTHNVRNKKRDDRTVGDKVSKLITRLKKAEKAGVIDLYKSRVYLYEKPKVSYLSQNNTFALDESEISALYRLKLTGDKEKIRDVFVFQVWSGQRFSDIPNLNNGIIDRENKLIKIIQEKETEPVTIPILPIALEILNKYDWNLPLFPMEKTNETLKEVAQMARLTREHYVTHQHRGDVKSERRMICDDLATHCARRTFITLMLTNKYLTKEETQAISGHRTDSAFNRYVKVNKDKIADNVIHKFYGEKMEQPQQVPSVPVTAASTSQVTIDYIERSVREKIQLENTVKEQAEQLHRQEQETSTMRQRMERQGKELKDYQDTITTAEYIDKVGDLAMQAEQDAIFLYREQP
ncbi:MAG: phage integrase SAM-like domain-containing protein [Prevotella sp.]|nr:phage integrase SAM-like domain-containing protein [Prevotella sp.]